MPLRLVLLLYFLHLEFLLLNCFRSIVDILSVEESLRVCSVYVQHVGSMMVDVSRAKVMA